MKPGVSIGRIPEERICKRSCERYRRIGEGRGSRKPIRGSDVEANRSRNCFRTQTSAARNDAQQPKGGDKFTEQLRATGAGVLRELYDSFTKHQMCCSHANKCTK